MYSIQELDCQNRVLIFMGRNWSCHVINPLNGVCSIVCITGNVFVEDKIIIALNAQTENSRTGCFLRWQLQLTRTLMFKLSSDQNVWTANYYTHFKEVVFVILKEVKCNVIIETKSPDASRWKHRMLIELSRFDAGGCVVAWLFHFSFALEQYFELWLRDR